eukprot:1024741-Prymnesium_polylepis.1
MASESLTASSVVHELALIDSAVKNIPRLRARCTTVVDGAGVRATVNGFEFDSIRIGRVSGIGRACGRAPPQTP